MNTQKQKLAETIEKKIRFNVNLYELGWCGREQFCLINHALWDEAAEKGVADEVRQIQLRREKGGR